MQVLDGEPVVNGHHASLNYKRHDGRLSGSIRLFLAESPRTMIWYAGHDAEVRPPRTAGRGHRPDTPNALVQTDYLAH